MSLASINDLSQVIGELRNFASQQVTTNQYIVEELKHISDRISGIGEIGATLVEYRKTMHERFNHIGIQMGDIDNAVDRLDDRLRIAETVQATWRSNIKFILAIGWFVGTVMSSLITTYAGAIIKAMAH